MCSLNQSLLLPDLSRDIINKSNLLLVVYKSILLLFSNSVIHLKCSNSIGFRNKYPRGFDA